ncbi:MAG: WD40/YVTN/BNR-like repeat-containing protein [Gemmobacter sp.]
MADDTTVLVGTTKGLFLLTSGPDRARWRLSGPFCDGWPVNHAIGDAATGDIWAGGGGTWYGPGVWRRAGGDWTLSQGPFEPAEQVWSLARDGARMLAGTKPAMLWESHDQGATWAKLPALTDQPGAEEWQPGAAGLVLHTILCGGQGQVTVGISSAGAFHTQDGGQTWERRTRRSNRPGPAGALDRFYDGEEFRPEGEIFSCVHNMAFGAAPGLIYMQNHQGVYRSRDGGQAWEEITEGLPSTFGFPVAAHPRDPGTLWVFPLNGDSIGRYPVDGVAKVWRSRDGGETWAGFGAGLPERDFFATVLRQGMANDRADPAGVYFGTNSGSVFASRDEGETWQEIAAHLPTVLSVEVMA